MSKTLHELINDLKDFIIDIQSDAHNVTNLTKQRYNNLKLKIITKDNNSVPRLQISIGISEAVFDITTITKVSGGLGPDEKYVFRWLARTSTIQNLKDFLNDHEKQFNKEETPDN